MPEKKITWILVADGKHAIIYANDGPGGGLYRATENEFSIDLASKVGDLMSDQEGRAANPGGSGSQVYGPRTDPRKHQESEFLRAVSAYLEETAQARMYQRLVLCAPPKALGELRKFLGSQTKKLVAEELHKNLANLSDKQVEEHLMADEIIR